MLLNLDNAIENQIKIHTIGLGSGASNTTLKSYAEQTGGEFFKATTAENLEEIYDSLSIGNQFDFDTMTDTDGDGIPDEIEVSGLPCSNGMIFFTDPDKTDTDGDGLKDSEEVIPTVCRNSYCVNVLDETIRYKYSFEFRSDPTKVDSDGDGYDDKIDFNPINYDIVLYLSTLCELAQNYYVEHNLGSKEEQITLVLEFIRSKKYNGSKWNFTAGDVNDNFVNYVRQENKQVYNFFLDNKGLITKDPITKIDYDFTHMAATLNAYFEKNDVKTMYNFIIGENDGMNNLAGWAGDIQQCIEFNIINYYEDSFTITENESKNRALAHIGANIDTLDSCFSLADLYADMDAVNLYYLYRNNNQMDLKELLDKYFSITNNTKRYDDFIFNLSGSNDENSFEKIIYNYTYPLVFGNVQVYSYDAYQKLTESIAKGASTAFTEIIFSKRK